MMFSTYFLLGAIDLLAILQQSLLHYFVHFYMKGLIE